MNRNKERILIQHKAGAVDTCLCLSILKLKSEQLRREYELLVARLRTKHPDSKQFAALLPRVMRASNRNSVVRDIIREIETSNEILESLVPVEINGRTTYRRTVQDDFIRSCKGKVANTEKEASSIARDMSVRTNENLEPYKCRHCEHWHVGHSNNEFSNETK